MEADSGDEYISLDGYTKQVYEPTCSSNYQAYEKDTRIYARVWERGMFLA